MYSPPEIRLLPATNIADADIIISIPSDMLRYYRFVVDSDGAELFVALSPEHVAALAKLLTRHVSRQKRPQLDGLADAE